MRPFNRCNRSAGWATIAGVLAWALAACGGPSARPEASTSVPRPSAKEAAQTSAAVSWADTEAAAKREGKIVVWGPPGADVREGLTKGFQRQYPDIQVEFN